MAMAKAEISSQLNESLGEISKIINEISYCERK
jgi:hypothetical protein